MKKIIGMLLALAVISGVASADDYAIYGGIKGDLTLKAGVYNYQEICFVSGEPVALFGTVKIPAVPDKDSYKMTLKYQLASADGAIKLSRDVSYNVAKSNDNVMNQTTVKTTIPIGGLKETYSVGKDVYQLAGFQFNNSDIRDVHPAITFSSGNIYYKKVFYKNGDATTAEGKLTIVGESKVDLSYDNHWSQLTTQIVDLSFQYEPNQNVVPATAEQTTAAETTASETTSGGATSKTTQSASNTDQTTTRASEATTQSTTEKTAATDADSSQTPSAAWRGNATIKFSTDMSADFSYVRNDVQNISFRGGLLKTENSNVVLQYSYDMPAKGGARNIGEDSLNSYTFEDATRLPVPKYKDIAGHWAEDKVFKMASLGAFEPDGFFFPDTYVTRQQFAMALVNSIDYLPPEAPEVRRSEAIKALRPKAEPLPFEDVERDSLYYIYVDRVNRDGLMIGEGNSQFLPNRPLTRQEAITILIRALGIQDIAPTMPYSTGYRDDGDISIWAKDALYMAREVGVVTGYPDNTARPLALMTRAEAATLLSRFIDHLRDEITTDYREKLLNAY